MIKKPGRNDPCWCGSGLKYKHCHLDKEKQATVNVWQAATELRKTFDAKYCLAPTPMRVDCSGPIVKAHTVPKSGSLQKIARNGHVFSFIPTLENMIKYEGRLQPELVGINRASTFTGFCSKHDNSVFYKIENQPFQSSQEQCFLLAYRAQARELFTKKALVSSSSIRRQADRGKSPEEQLAIHIRNAAIDTGAYTGLRDCEYYKELYDAVLLGRDFSAVHAYIIELHSPPTIMCSGGIFPEQDFEGNQLQDLYNLDRTPHLLNFTSFSSEKRGFIVFSWLAESDPTCFPFIHSLTRISPERTTDAVIRFFFEFCENLHISPEWWESLADTKRNSLINRVAASMNADLHRKPGCLAGDGFRYDDWPIFHTKAVGY